MPALITIHMARKPLDGTVAGNALKHGTGSLNIGDTRLGHTETLEFLAKRSGRPAGNAWADMGLNGKPSSYTPDAKGRWPANVIFQHAAGCRCEGTKRVTGTGIAIGHRGVRDSHLYGKGLGHLPEGTPDLGYADPDGKEAVEDWICAPGCPVADLDEQSGERKTTWVAPEHGNNRSGEFMGALGHPGQQGFNDTGGASRFFKQVTTDEEAPMPDLTTIHMARKPLDGTVAGNALKYGTGSLNIGDTRIGGEGGTCRTGRATTPTPQGWANMGGHDIESLNEGRWPANVILEHLPGCKLVGSHHESFDINVYDGSTQGNYRSYKASDGPLPEKLGSVENGQTVDEWECVEGCPVADIDEQSGVTVAKRSGRGVGYTDSPVYHPGGPGAAEFDTVRGFDDKGGASRYFKQVQGDQDMAALTVAHMARKPLDGTVAENALKHGTGSLNIDGTRIGGPKPDTTRGAGGQHGITSPRGEQGRILDDGQGRWPANVVLEHLPGCKLKGTLRVRPQGGSGRAGPGSRGFQDAYVGGEKRAEGFTGGQVGDDGKEEVERWVCKPGCPVADIDEQSGVLKSGAMSAEVQRGSFGQYGVYGKADGSGVGTDYKATEGGASRFFKQGQSTDLIAYLLTMASTPDATAYFVDTEHWPEHDKDWPDGSICGFVVQGKVTQWHVDEFMRLLPPGGHIFLIAPDEQPTGHTGAILLEDSGFEIRDAILLVKGPGRTHYVAKAGRREREAGCGNLTGKAGHEAVERAEGSAGVDNPRAGAGRTADHVKNFHPTVKPVEVMERLLADVPKDQGPVLDPFMGSGTTGIACSKTGHSFIGIERDPEYLEIADARVRYWDRTHVGWQGAEIESDHKVNEPEPEAMDLMDFFA